jgi:hypothetical protein
LVCGVLVESVKIDLVATSLFLLLDFIIIIILFALGFRFQRRRSIIARHFWKWIEDFVVTFFWSSSSRSCTSFSKNWPRAEGRRSDWREFFFFFFWDLQGWRRIIIWGVSLEWLSFEAQTADGLMRFSAAAFKLLSGE